MTEITEGQAMCSTPTRLQLFWRWAGWHYHLGEVPNPEAADLMPGWIRTDMRLDFGWPDRLRLLMTGRLRISSIVHTDTVSPDKCVSRMDWHILAPGDRDH